MPLATATLQSALQSTFSSPGATIADCSSLWANAIGTYFAPVAPPSLTVAAAQATLQTQLAAAFALPAAASAMDAACTAFAATVGAGMLPAFVAVPPPAPVNWLALFAEPYPTTHAEAAQKISSALDTWARTGTATPSLGGSPIPWT